MPKLLIVNITCNQGSTGKISEQIGLLMQARSWDVYYAHGARRIAPSRLKTIPFSSVIWEYLHALISLLFDADGLGSFFVTKRLVKKIKEIKPDIIQLNNLHGYYLNYKVLFKYLNNTDVPVVITMHDCWNITGHCTHFVTAKCEKWKDGCSKCPLLGVSPKSFLDGSKKNYKQKKELFAGNKNLHVVAVSNWLASIVEQSFLKDKNLSVIHNGVDVDVFRLSEKRLSKSFTILGVSNVWNKDKGFYDILKLREMLPEEFQIVLVGVSEKQKRSLPDGIKGIMYTSSQKELAELYSEADVLINPTYADTFPTINLESMACGTPVVSYQTGGSPESITSETGIIVKVGDIKGMKDSIIWIRDHPFDSMKCREHIIDNFDKNNRFEDYYKLYNELFQQKRV